MSERSRLTKVEIESSDLLAVAGRLFGEGFCLAAIVGHDDVTAVRVVYLFTKGPPDQRVELTLHLDAQRPEVDSLAALSFSASRFEREMHDTLGVVAKGHPNLRRLVLHQHWPDDWLALRATSSEAPEMIRDASPYPFVSVEGPGVYEVPVGPVHAGLIEPGHFRFFVVGETILRMKARLWFVHKGIERLVIGTRVADAFQIAQRISGDTTVGHGLAFALAVEEASGLEVTQEDHIARAMLLELERLYNHVSDIGALCNDVGFSVANSMAMNIRERLLRLNQRVTGHRLLRGGVQVGGADIHELPDEHEVTDIERSVDEVVSLIRSNALVMERFDGTARLGSDDAVALGTVGVVARASGVDFDARLAHPFLEMPPTFHVVTRDGGDVRARFDVRVDEIGTSLQCVRYWSQSLARSLRVVGTRPAPSQSTEQTGLGIVEGWRGAIVHRIEFADGGRIGRLKVVDPSFLNWPALPISLSDTILPDFPLANKSFNLSYAGNDL